MDLEILIQILTSPQHVLAQSTEQFPQPGFSVLPHSDSGIPGVGSYEWVVTHRVKAPQSKCSSSGGIRTLSSLELQQIKLLQVFMKIFYVDKPFLPIASEGSLLRVDMLSLFSTLAV